MFDSYARGWRRKREWYERDGFIERLITGRSGGFCGVNAVKKSRLRFAAGIVMGLDPQTFEPAFIRKPNDF